MGQNIHENSEKLGHHEKNDRGIDVENNDKMVKYNKFKSLTMKYFY